jgi:hypothetical protein
MVAVAKARHQPGYGIGLKSGWDRHFRTQFNRPKKKVKSHDTIHRSTLPLRVEQSVETQDGSLQRRTTMKPQRLLKMVVGALVTLALVTLGGRTLAEFKQIPMQSFVVLAFGFGLALLTGVIFGAAAAWFATRTDLP